MTLAPRQNTAQLQRMDRKSWSSFSFGSNVSGLTLSATLRNCSVNLLLVLLCLQVFDAQSAVYGQSNDDVRRIEAVEQQLKKLQDEVRLLRVQLAEAARRLEMLRRQARDDDDAPRLPVLIAGAPSKGDNKASVALIEYSDFHCPYCRRYARDTFPTIVREYVETGKLLYVFRHFPLDNLHPEARIVAETATCAQRQGRFWELRDRLLLGSHVVPARALDATAVQVGIDVDALAKCLHTGDAARQIANEVMDARRLGLTSTPSFILGTVDGDGRVTVSRRITGAQPPALFREEIEALLRRK